MSKMLIAKDASDTDESLGMIKDGLPAGVSARVLENGLLAYHARPPLGHEDGFDDGKDGEGRKGKG